MDHEEMKKISGWRCPYCDALNDWQDSVCQICGDGRRDKAGEAAGSPQVSGAAQPDEQNRNSEISSAPQPEAPDSRMSGTQRTEAASRASAVPPQRWEDEPPGRYVAPEKPEKKHRLRRWLVRLLVVTAAFFGVLCVYSVIGSRKIADRVDLELLAEMPQGVSDKEVVSWLEGRGYEVDPWIYETSSGGTGISEGTYFVDDPAMDPGDYSILYRIECGAYFVSYMRLPVPCPLSWISFYGRLTKRMEENGWEKLSEGTVPVLNEDYGWTGQDRKMATWRAENGAVCYFMVEQADFWDAHPEYYRPFKRR